MAYMQPFGRSAVRRKVMEAFLLHKGREVHVRELARQLGFSAPAVSKELGILEGMGLLRSRVVGRSKLYVLNTASPMARSIEDLFQKTVGVEAVLRDAVAPIVGLESASIFGSYASGEERASSDLDLLIIGHVDRRDVMSRVADAERLLGREVNILILTPEQWRSRQDSGLIRDIVSKPVVPIIAGAGGTYS